MATAVRKTNWFAIWISVGVVIVLVGVVAVVAVLNSRATDPGPVPAASGINRETGAVTFGKGPDKVSTWVDFMCPYCGQFEKTNGDQIKEWVTSGAATVEIHPIAILTTRSNGTKYSERSANAAACVADRSPDSFFDFNSLLFANQPAEGTDGL
jgi:protein-disulfide isomerase